MKKHLINILALLVCLHGLAWTSIDDRKSFSAADLVEAFHAESAQALPKALSAQPIVDLAVAPKALFFRLQGMPFHLEWLGKPGRLFKLNGRVFSARDLESEKAFSKAFRSRFGLSMKSTHNIGLWSVLFSQAFAETTGVDASLFDDSQLGNEATPAPSGETTKAESSEATQASADAEGGVTFEDMDTVNFNKFLKSDNLFPQGASLAQTQVGKRLNIAFDLMTGANQLAMIKFMYMFLGGLQFAMNPAGGLSPGLGVINNIGVAPSSVAFPY